MKKHFSRFVLGIACVLAVIGHAAHLWQIPFVSVVDAYLYDVRVRLSASDTVDDRVVVVDLDEKSLAEVGRWPWSRNTVAAMVKRLTDDYKVAVVGFDVVFAEPDESSGLKVLEDIGRGQLREVGAYQTALHGLRSSLNYDRLFANTLKGRPVVLGYYFSSMADAREAGALPAPVFPEGYFKDRPVNLTSWKGFGGNLPVFQEKAASAGHFNPLPDFDGVSRRVPLVVEHGGAYYEALSLAMVRTILGNAELRPGFPENDSGMEWLEVATPRGSLKIPVDEYGAALIPYRGPERSFPYVSAVDVLKGRVPAEKLLGRIVLVGTTAPGLMDLRSTPVGATYPGVEIHANLIAGILDGNVKQKPSYVLGAEVVQLLFFGCLLALLLPLLSPFRSSLLALLILGLILTANYWLWQSQHLVLPLASGIFLVVILFGLNMSWGYFVESRTKRQLTGLFGQYVPPELVDEMARDPENYSMEGRKEELTVLFSDVRGFTTISEGLDPKELALLMNEYLGPMTTVVRRNRGTLDKYIGDAIMAFWGAPVADADHARHAVLTALEMQREVKKLAEPFKARGWPELRIGVGVNSGTMTVGDMGSPVRQAYTVMGDAVNLASRLEGITKEYGVGIVVGEATRDQLKDIVFRELDRVRVKGKDEPVAIYEPLGVAGEVPQEAMDELKLWQNALRLYRAQDWDGAEMQLVNLLQRHPESHLYQLYSERVRLYRANPPGENWDGAFTFKTK
ncbi:MAG TPA: adenylate/guanylate cyclase domain-containing protein [Rhodocyclaceae bacterium]|nr:adenylate/guanylate cyclase domain-containing protein [Rhodocyclaceae bacterium]